MKSMYSHCIFCFKELPTPRGLGDHMIPGYLGGSIKFKDICTSCNKHIGQQESKAIEDRYIIDAINFLDIDDLKNKIKDKATVSFITKTGEIIKGKSKNGQPKIVPRYFNNNFVEKDPDDTKNQLLKQYPDLRQEINNTFKQIKNTGIFLKVPGIPVYLRSAEASVRFDYKVSNKAVLPLISKIAYQLSMHYIIDPLKREPIVPFLSQIYNYLLGQTDKLESDNLLFLHHPSFNPNEFNVQNCKPYHHIYINYEQYGYSFDIILFDNIPYRLIFLCNSYPLTDQIFSCKSIGYVMSVHNKDQKHLFIHEIGEEKGNYYEASFL